MNENSAEQSSTKSDTKQDDINEGSPTKKGRSNGEKKQKDNDDEGSKNDNENESKKKGTSSARKGQHQRNPKAKEPTTPVADDKKKLSRDELKNLRAIELMEKIEFESKRKEENSRKRQKKDQENVQNQLSLEKSISNENGKSSRRNSRMASPVPSPRREQVIEENALPVERTESQKKLDNRAFSKFLNPTFDLQGSSNLVAYIHDYQANIFKRRAEEDSKHLIVQANGKNEHDFSSQRNNLIFEVNESAISDQQSSCQQVSVKFTEYLNRNRQEGKFRDTLEMLRGFKH